MEAEAPGAASAAAKKKKPNSPKAPGIALRGAVAEVTKVYRQYSHSTFTRGEMASSLGMSSGSGAFYAKAATLNMYGLVEESGGKIKVSDAFKALHQAPASSAEMKRNALQAISKPVVFASLLRQFGQKIPDESAIALRLEMSERFNRDRALEVASAFRSSLADFGLIDGNGNVLPVRDEQDGGVPGHDDEDDQQATTPGGGSKVADIPAQPGTFRVEVPLANGRRAIVALPEDVSAADTTKICAILNAYATS
jgi:hypothetical protein